MPFEKIGDWGKVGYLIANLGKEMKIAQQQSLMRWGLQAEKLAKKHLRDQDLGWKELNAEYLAQKIRKGQSEKTLIATSDYMQAINSWVEDDVALCGVRKDVTYTNSEGTELIYHIAEIHEYGKGGMPARPLWQPVMDEMKTWFPNSGYTPVDIFRKNIAKYQVGG